MTIERLLRQLSSIEKAPHSQGTRKKQISKAAWKKQGPAKVFGRGANQLSSLERMLQTIELFAGCVVYYTPFLPARMHNHPS